MDNKVEITKNIISIISQANKGDISKKQYAEYADQILNYLKELPEEYHTPLLYHQTWLMVKAENEVYRKNLRHITGNSTLIEAIWLTIQLDIGDSNEKRWEYEEKISDILPICPWILQTDARKKPDNMKEEKILVITGIHWPVIPSIELHKLKEIATLFNEMNMTDNAAHAFREAIYNHIPPSFFKPKTHETWISPETMDMWLTLTRLEAGANRPQWALQALCMAAASDQSRIEEVMELVPLIYQEPETINAQYNKEKLIRIAELYRKSNLHPRAFEVLEIAEKKCKTAVKEMKSEITSEWTELIAQYSMTREQTEYLFGMRVAEYKETPLELYPHPFLYERLKM